jgi:thiamine biosynthesis lipoprotein ApbE
MRRSHLIVVGLLLAVGAALLTVRPRAQPYTFHYENVLGTSMDLTVLAGSEEAAKAGEAAALRQIDHDARILSGYDRASEFSRWFQTRGAAAPISPELFDVLGLFDTWRARTGGALDASAERVSRVWKAAAVGRQLPSDADLAMAVHDVRQRHWILDPVARTATHVTDTPLILNSFTKSYIVDRAARAVLATPSIRGVVVNVGGDMVVRGDWTETVRVTDPRDDADNGAPFAIARSPRAADTVADSTSPATTTRTSSIRGPDDPPAG